MERQLANVIIAAALARSGLGDSARKVLVSVQTDRGIDPRQDVYGYIAIPYIILGDHAKAIELLKNYVAVNPTHEFSLSNGDLHWWWRPLRNEPGFQVLVGRR